ncbi:LysR family transcriptional regulator [Colwellia demingiae]|nr:LysR family transcriptional regulator [Colwellia demingiae]
MIEQKLSRIDLNLLVSLNVLLKEKSVTRAAQRLFVSQSAMSKTLKRLRETFDDPLFYRTSEGLVPSEKAKQIGKVLFNVFDELHEVINQDFFDPLTSQANFSLSIPSILGTACTLPLFNALASKAPLMSFTEYAAKANPFHMLENSTLDFSIYLSDELPANFTSTYIGDVQLAIFARKDHPLSKVKLDKANGITLKECVAYNFISLMTEGEKMEKFSHPIDNVLSAHGLQRNIIFGSNQLQILMEILRTSDHLFIAPSVVMKSVEFSKFFNPIYHFASDKKNDIKLFLVEHDRIQKSPEHQWFKQELLTHLKAMNDKS